MENVQKLTPIGKTYYGGDGVYQSEYGELYKSLVPGSGSAGTLHGELIRSISRLGHEYNNNGNCNLIEQDEETDWVDCHNCGGSGMEDGEYDEESETYYETQCSCCGGSGGEDETEYGEVTINEYYLKFIELIQKSVPTCKKEITELELWLLQNSTTNFSMRESNRYDIVFDKVIFFVLTTEDMELPSWYDIG